MRGVKCRVDSKAWSFECGGDYRLQESGKCKGRILGVECGVGSVRCRVWSLGM